jgi:predicted transcriptional regulator
MDTYQPNFNDPKVRRRTQQVIEWIEKYVGAETLSLSKQVLEQPQAFGSSQLGRYLRGALLIKTCPAFQPGVFSQQYRVNIDYLNRLRKHVGLEPSSLKHNNIDRRFEQQADEIATGNFEYNLSGNRWHNGLQHVPRELKQEYWVARGYTYDYDADTCAPTLLLQRAKKLKPAMKSLSYIEYFIANKKEVRNNLSIAYNLSLAQVKQIINALFQGGILNSYKDNKILGYLNNNTYKMRQLKQDQFLLELINDIKSMWAVLRSDITTGYEYRGDVRRSKRITGKHKSDYYKQLEYEVMGVVWKSLKKKNIKFFREHDGFRTTEFVVPNELEQLILGETGYHVTFKWDKLDSNDVRALSI